MMNELPKTKHALDSIATRKVVVVGIVRDAVDELLAHIAERDLHVAALERYAANMIARERRLRSNCDDDEWVCIMLNAVMDVQREVAAYRARAEEGNRDK